MKCLNLLKLVTLLTLIQNHSCKPPNIIIFLADDLGWDDVGFHGSLQMSTPNIDCLAADGIILNNYHSSPVCTPSRGALLSGVHPIHSGTQNYVILTPAPWGLPLDIELMPQHLKKLDYSSHIVGKWHLGFFKKEYTPTFRGFDSHVGYWTGAGDYYDHTALEDKKFWGLDFRNGLDLITDAAGVYSTDYFTERAIRVIEQHNTSKPLFLYMAYQSVHDSNHYSHLQAPEELIKKFDYITNEHRRIFAAMAYSMDKSIGEIISKLNQRKMLSESIILFLSDNGGPASGFTGNAASNWPLRGVKATLFDGGVRVPAVVWSPLISKSRRVMNQLIHVTDLMPSLFEAIGLNWTSNRPIYGIPQWRVLSDDAPSLRKELLHNIDPLWNVSAIRHQNWKLVQGLVFPHWTGWLPTLSCNDTSEQFVNQQRLQSKTFTILKQMGREPKFDVFNRTQVKCGPRPTNSTFDCHPDQSPCLFNTETDPCEYYNVAADHPEVVQLLWQRILTLNQTASPPATLPNDPEADPSKHNYAWSCWKDEES